MHNIAIENTDPYISATSNVHIFTLHIGFIYKSFSLLNERNTYNLAKSMYRSDNRLVKA